MIIPYVNKYNIARNIRDRRLKAKLSIAEVAEMLGVNAKTLSHYELDGFDDFDLIQNLCHVLSIDIEDVIDNSTIKIISKFDNPDTIDNKINKAIENY